MGRRDGDGRLISSSRRHCGVRYQRCTFQAVMSAEEKEQSDVELGIFRTRKEIKPERTSRSDNESSSASKPTVAPFSTLRKIQPIVMKPLRHALHVNAKKENREASTEVGDSIVHKVEKSVVVGGVDVNKPNPEKIKRPSQSPSPTKTSSSAADGRSYQTLIMRKRTNECFAEIELKKKENEKCPSLRRRAADRRTLYDRDENVIGIVWPQNVSSACPAAGLYVPGVDLERHQLRVDVFVRICLSAIWVASPIVRSKPERVNFMLEEVVNKFADSTKRLYVRRKDTSKAIKSGNLPCAMFPTKSRFCARHDSSRQERSAGLFACRVRA
uniref:Uncharacterized protein n=1 Tax=Steinernema glaseri TaxID=37863 RepID=A0A1I7YSU9_9BILA